MPGDPKDVHTLRSAVAHIDMMNVSAKQGRMCSRAANHHLLEGGRERG